MNSLDIFWQWIMQSSPHEDELEPYLAIDRRARPKVPGALEQAKSDPEHVFYRFGAAAKARCPICGKLPYLKRNATAAEITKAHKPAEVPCDRCLIHRLRLYTLRIVNRDGFRKPNARCPFCGLERDLYVPLRSATRGIVNPNQMRSGPLGDPAFWREGGSLDICVQCAASFLGTISRPDRLGTFALWMTESGTVDGLFRSDVPERWWELPLNRPLLVDYPTGTKVSYHLHRTELSIDPAFVVINGCVDTEPPFYHLLPVLSDRDLSGIEEVSKEYASLHTKSARDNLVTKLVSELGIPDANAKKYATSQLHKYLAKSKNQTD